MSGTGTSSGSSDPAPSTAQKKKRSKWWSKYDEVSGGKKAKCKLCGFCVTVSGGTTNLKTHLRNKHFATCYFELSEAGDCDDEGDGDDVSASGDDDSTGAPTASPTPPPSPALSPVPPNAMSPPASPAPGPSTSSASSKKRQTTLSGLQAPDSKSIERYNMAVAFFIVTCCLPLSLVDKLGFILLCAVLRPGFKPAGRKALTNNYIPRLLTTTKQTLAKLLKDADWVACTSDTWTSKANDSYVALTAHYINNSWDLMCFTLCCRAFKEDHTGDNIKDFFKEALAEWKIPTSKVTSFTIDNGDNIRLAVDLLGVACMRCFGHTVQTGCTLLETMATLKQLRTASQKLLTLMSQTKTWNKYEEYMSKHHSGTEPRKLPHPVVTRWWSYLPLFRVLVEDEEYHRGFLAVFNKGKDMHLLLSESSLRMIKTLLATLSPLEELCTVLSADKYVTASAVLPVMYLLEKLLERARELSAARGPDGGHWSDDEDTAEDNVNPDPSMLKVVMNRLYKRYSPASWQSSLGEGVDVDVDREVRDRLLREKIRRCDDEGRESTYNLLVKCTYVDSRYRADLKPEDVQRAKEQLLDEISSHMDVNESVDSVSPPQKKKKGMGALFAKLATYAAGPSSQVASDVATQERRKTPREKLICEFEQMTVEKDADILIWWKAQEINFPLLSKLAKKYLAVPATSTESERLFSFAGLVINNLRTCLTGEHAECLIFLGMNKDFVQRP